MSIQKISFKENKLVLVTLSVCLVVIASVLLLTILPISLKYWRDLSQEPPCEAQAIPKGDINLDGVANVFDLGILIGHYGEAIAASSSQEARRSDLNNNTMVDIFDLGILAGSYGLTVPTPTLPNSSPTPTVNPTAFNFIAWGDTKDAKSVLSSLSNQAKNLSPNFTIYAGDLEDSGFTQSGMDSWKAAMNGGSNNGMFDKTFSVRGNHDSGNTSGWQGYYDFRATAQRVGATNYSELAADLTYSWDFGVAHFVAIDVTGDASKLSDNQVNWLDTDLTAAESRGLQHAFIMFHGPEYCVDGHCSCDTRTCTPTNAQIVKFVDVLDKHPIVSATFHGHEHTYSHTKIDSSRIPEVNKPYEQFVVGDAGAGPDGCDAWRVDYCMNAHGFVLVAVSGKTFTVEFYKEKATSSDKTLTFTK